LAIGGVALLLAGGGIVLSRWRTATSSLARKRHAAARVDGDARDEQAD
jgi:hypothetical protein